MTGVAIAYVRRVLDLLEAEWFRAADFDWSEIRGRYIALASAIDVQVEVHDLVEALLDE